MDMMTEATFIYSLADSLLTDSGAYDHRIPDQTHRHSMTCRALGILLLIGAESESLDFATLRTLPHVVIDSLQVLLKILGIIEPHIILLLREAMHLHAARRATNASSATATIDHQDYKIEYKSQPAREDSEF